MPEPIVKFRGMHIDLDKIVSITDAFFVDRMGFGGYFAEFRVHIQLLDEPLEFVTKIDADHSGRRTVPIYNKDGKIAGVVEWQKEADKLITLWMEYKNAKIGN